MRQELCRSPVEVGERGVADARRSVPSARMRALERSTSSFTSMPPPAWSALVGEVGQRRGIAVGAREGGHAERRECLERHDPGRDGAAEVLGEERPERLVLPGLDVAGGPVVEEAEAEEPRTGVLDRHRLALRVAAPDEETDLELVVEAPGGPEHRRQGRVVAGLAAGAMHVGAARHDGRSASVIADGDVLVVGQERIVGAEHLPDVGGVIDRGVEVGVVADRSPGAASRRHPATRAACATHRRRSGAGC